MARTADRSGGERLVPAVGAVLALGVGLLLWQTAGSAGPGFALATVLTGMLLVGGVALAASLGRRGATEGPIRTGAGEGLRELDEARQAAERRAGELQETVLGLRGQFKQMLEELKTAEARLEAREREAATSAEDLRAMREQLAETSGRLRKAELDNNALRQRLALRSTELDQVKGELARTTEQLHLSKLTEALRELEGVR